MPKAIITIGVSASGKSAWADEFVKTNKDYVKIEHDELRKVILLEQGIDIGDGNIWRFYDFRKHEAATQRLADTELDLHLQYQNYNLIFSDTNLNPKYRNQLVDKLQRAGYDVEIKEFPITFEEAVKRNAKRQHAVDKEVLYKQWQRWIDYLKSKGEFPNGALIQSPTPLHHAVLLDMEGTIALHTSGRSPFDEDRVHEDSCDLIVKHVIEGLDAKGYTIIVMSGRTEGCKEATEEWLQYYGIPYDEIHMRKVEDTRRDFEVKKDLFVEHVLGKFHVYAVFDDRPQVVRLWHDLGINKVFCVGNPWVEF